MSVLDSIVSVSSAVSLNRAVALGGTKLAASGELTSALLSNGEYVGAFKSLPVSDGNRHEHSLSNTSGLESLTAVELGAV